MAVQTVGKLAPADLATHYAALAAKLEDADAGMRASAMKTIGNLAPADLETHFAALATKLEDADGGVRSAAMIPLGNLSPADLETHLATLATKLEDADGGVREATVTTLGNLSLDVLATLYAPLAAMLEDANGRVRGAVVTALGKLAQEDPAAHTATVIAKFEDSDSYVREAAIEVLRQLTADDLAQHAPALVAKLEDSEWNVRMAAAEALGKLGAEADLLASWGSDPLAQALVAKFEHSDRRVRATAVEVLCHLGADNLAQYAPALAAKLEERTLRDLRSLARGLPAAELLVGVSMRKSSMLENKLEPLLPAITARLAATGDVPSALEMAAAATGEECVKWLRMAVARYDDASDDEKGTLAQFGCARFQLLQKLAEALVDAGQRAAAGEAFQEASEAAMEMCKTKVSMKLAARAEELQGEEDVELSRRVADLMANFPSPVRDGMDGE